MRFRFMQSDQHPSLSWRKARSGIYAEATVVNFISSEASFAAECGQIGEKNNDECNELPLVGQK